MKKVKLAIVGVGNCASSLVQGLEYYKTASAESAGLMHADIGGYTLDSVEVVAAFDVDARKVGKPLEEAIFAEPGVAGAKYGLSVLGKCADAVRLPLT